MYLVDIGNTWTKSAYLREGLLFYAPPIKTLDLAKKPQEWPTLPEIGWRPEKILISSVSKKEVASSCRATLWEAWSIEPEFVKVSRVFKGMTTQYDTKSLGVDRWLACLAAWSARKQHLIVVDAGTAITMDFITKEGTHKGGLIAPGPRAMADSLEKNTALLPKVEDKIKIFSVPSTTEDAIVTGIESSIIGLLSQIKLNARDIFDSDPLWLLTGGEAKRLSSGINWPHAKQENLVLDGLRVYGTP